MIYKKTILDIIKVSISNLLILISGTLVGFLLPRIVGIDDYGYYKTYTLYCVYIGLFHFGIADGIYLKYAGKKYEELDKVKFSLYTKFFIMLELFFSIVLASIAMIFMKDEYRLIFLFLSIYLFFHNITSYYQIISQATSRFNELSKRNMLQSVLIALLIIIFFILNRYFKLIINYKMYLIGYSIVIILLALWYMYTYKKISYSTEKGDTNIRDDIIEFVKIGFPLMLANLCSSLILTLDRQFVSLLFDTKEYAIYAFAYNMLSLVTTSISAISTVIYPKLKQVNEKNLNYSYDKLLSVILIIVFISLVIYFPLNIFVGWFLPQYIDSLIIFRIIFPGLAISSAITIVMHNYYKTLNLNVIFFKKCIIILVISILTNFLAYIFWKSTLAISLASIVTMLLWYILVESHLIITYNVKWKMNLVYMIIMILVFYTISEFSNVILSGILYLIICSIITILCYRKNIFALFAKGE